MDLESTKSALDNARKKTPKNVEYWMARDIQVVLGYKTWEGFEQAIQRAMRACEQSGEDVENHFRQTSKMIETGKTAQRRVVDYFLDRYACYLIAMNGESSIPQIASAQTYFAVQTRKQELREESEARDEIDLRIEQRDKLTVATKELNKAASAVGVQNFAFFVDAGYKGLYEMGLAEIKRKKGLSERDKLYDRASRVELAANAFHKTQTEEKIKRSSVQGQKQAEQMYRDVGQDVRAAIRKIGGIMPEDMPPEESLTQIERQRKKALRAPKKR